MTETEVRPAPPAGPVSRRSFLRAHAAMILGFTAAVALGAAVVSALQPSTYTSVARVVVEARLLPSGGAPPPPDMGTEKAVATSSAVTQAAAALLGTPARRAAEGLAVKVPVDTHVLEFRSTGPVAREATRRAQAFSQAYVDYNRFHSSSSRRLVPQAAEIISPASRPSSPSGPNRLVQIVAATLVGAGLSTAAAGLFDRWDRHVRGAGHLAELTGARPLAVVPRPGVSGPRRLLITSGADSAAAEAYRFLQTKLLEPVLPQGARILVTCAGNRDREARDVVSANLAAAVAEAGWSVLLVPDTAERPALEAMVSPGSAVDVSPEVVDLAQLQDSGAGQPRQRYDVVIVQAAPVRSSARTLRRLRQCDACLLVVDLQLSSRDEVGEAYVEAVHGSFSPVTTVLTAPCSPRRAGLDARWGRRLTGNTDLRPTTADDTAMTEGLA
jgi:hypothetical protein